MPTTEPLENKKKKKNKKKEYFTSVLSMYVCVLVFKQNPIIRTFQVFQAIQTLTHSLTHLLSSRIEQAEKGVANE